MKYVASRDKSQQIRYGETARDTFYIQVEDEHNVRSAAIQEIVLEIEGAKDPRLQPCHPMKTTPPAVRRHWQRTKP